MTKNNKKVITIAVPIDIDDAYLEKIKLMLENYKPSDAIAEIPSTTPNPAKSYQEEVFTSEKDVITFMAKAGRNDYKIPKHDMGIYYDEGLTIKKIEDNFLVKVLA
jgi:hypothetical protein